MPVELGTALQILTTVMVFAMGLVATAAGWYFKNHIADEIEQNSQFRQYAGGTVYDNDHGALGDLESLTDGIEEMHAQMTEQHEHVSKKVDYVIIYTRRIADEIDGEVDEPPARWPDSQDPPNNSP